jgi:predicted Holliday junction resolvase-like endonuclease
VSRTRPAFDHFLVLRLSLVLLPVALAALQNTMERLLSKRRQLAREVKAATEQKVNEMMKREVKRERLDSSKSSRNGDVVVDPVTGHQTVRFFRLARVV